MISIHFRAYSLEGADRRVSQMNSVFSLQQTWCGETCDEPPWKPRWFRDPWAGRAEEEVGAPVFLQWQLTECQERPYLNLAAHRWLAKKKVCWNMSDEKLVMWISKEWITVFLTHFIYNFPVGIFKSVMNKGLNWAHIYFNPYRVFQEYISDAAW